MLELTTGDQLDVNTCLAEIQQLYEDGLYLQALQRGCDLGDLAQWPEVRGKILAARIASQTGASRRADWLFRCVHKQAPESGEARYYYAYGLLRRRGPYHARRWMLSREPMTDDASLDVRSSWLALQAQVAGALRDFDEAEHWLNQARELQPDNAWILVCCSSILEGEDRYDEAYQAVERALALRPNYRPAIQAAGHLLVLLGREREALELLERSASRLECYAVAAQSYALLLERREYAEASRALDRVEELSPLAEKHFKQWIAAQRAEIAYYLDDIEGAIRFAEQSDSEYQKAIAARLKEPDQASRKRVLLQVTFVRQHQMTCAPATLSAISRYWDKPADHLQVADEICYNGTSWYSERKWARENGWETREFSITEESAVALLDRGIPFTFTTVEPTDSHLQAIIGYDGRRGTLHVRDPFWPNVGEGLTHKVLERYRAHGPRGMAMVPIEQSAKLADLDLPDCRLWDLLNAVDGALQHHRRDEAVKSLAEMQQLDANHRVTLEARRRLAGYDGNSVEHLSVVEELLQQFPDEPRLQLERLSLLRHQARRDERLAIYDRMCKAKDSHPIFWQQYAQELREDARRHEDAALLLAKAIRRWPTHASNYYILANLYWEQRRFDEALHLYRIAVCLDDKDEQLAASYFSAARTRNRSAEAIELLRARFTRYCYKSGLPARTLASAYLQLERTGEALDIVDQALTLRHDDGELLLFAAQAHLEASLENLPRASALIERAKDKVPQLEYVRAAARIASYDGRPGDSLKLWKQVLELQPMLIEAHARVAQLTAETEGNAAALEHLARAAERFPHYYPLHELWITWLREEPFAVREPAIRHLLDVNPDNAWAHREYALWLSDEKRFAEAWAEAEIAGKLEPSNVSFYLLRGDLYRSQNQPERAREEYKRAVELSVDNDYAISSLLSLCTKTNERREALRFIRDELVAQVIVGDGLLTFRQFAVEVLDADELLTILREANAARPDLWHAWSAHAQQLLQMQRLDEAWELIHQATERFPSMPRLWLDRAEIGHARLDAAGERAALEAALRINPGWAPAVRALAEYHVRSGEFGEAQHLLERGTSRSPLDYSMHVSLGEVLWRLGEKDAALERAKQAVQIEPGYDRAWSALEFWSAQLGRPEVALEAARDLTQRRAGEARSWLILAGLLESPEQAEERLEILERAIELNPRATDGYDQKAKTLATLERFDEAVAACRPQAFAAHPPLVLQARAIWVDWVRGRHSEAIRAMKQLVEDEPLFYGGWYMLADWSRVREDKETYLTAAEALVRLNPQSEVSWGFLADARLMNGLPELAAEAFEHAFELDPQYEFAGNMVFDGQLEAGKLDEAADTLRRLRMHSDSSFVLSRAAQLAARQGKMDEALNLLRQVCMAPFESQWPVAAACQAIRDMGTHGAQAVGETLHALVQTPEVDPFVGAYWAEMSVDANDSRISVLIEALQGTTPAAVQAAHALLTRWAQGNQRDNVTRFVNTNREWLRKDDLLWGGAGYALTTIRDWSRAAAWMSDWKTRSGAKPWMLVNTAESLRAVGKDAEGAECSKHALKLPPDNGTRLHELLLAADAAFRGDFDYVAEHLPAVTDRESLDLDYQFLVALVDAVMEVAGSSEPERGRAFRRAMRQIDAAKAEYAVHLPHEPSRQRFLAAATRQATKEAHRWWAWLWYYGRKLSDFQIL
jgi:cellulose synthase operon protein C